MKPEDRAKRPERLGDILAAVLEHAGLTERVAQAGVIVEWPAAVGPQIASVTEALFLQQDGTLVVGVKTHAWMTELSMLEPDLLRRLNVNATRPPVTGLRWTLRR